MAYARGTFGKPNQDTEQYYSEMTSQRFNNSQYHLPRPVKAVDRQAILGKLAAISQQLYEVIFLKQSVNSLVSEQRVKMCDFMRDLKRHLFQLGVKSQRDSLSKRGLSESSVMEVQMSSRQLVPENAELQRTCEQLRKENQILKEKYQSMLIHYREEVESLSSALARSLQQAGDQEGKDAKSQLMQAEEKLRQEQGRFAERVKYLESEFMGLEQEYLKERQGYQRQLQQYRQRQRQLTFQESQIQRKNILLIERDKVITQREIMLKQERGTLDRRENKISDYEHNQLRREKQKIDTQKYALKSQYYVSYDRLPEPQQHRHHDARSERERSGGRLANSRVDINARLREIQQQKRGGQSNFKNSRMSEAGGIRSQRSSSKSRTPLTYGVSRQPISTGLNVNVKLQSMLESLQRDLSDMK